MSELSMNVIVARLQGQADEELRCKVTEAGREFTALLLAGGDRWITVMGTPEGMRGTEACRVKVREVVDALYQDAVDAHRNAFRKQTINKFLRVVKDIEAAIKEDVK